MDLDSVATRLYGELPEAFTSSRSAEVRAARSAGDRQLAAAVAQLRRPTIGAWLANQLSRECRDDVEALLALGASMRRAQEAGDGQELRDLTRQRRQMVAALLSEAKKLARARNQPLEREQHTRTREHARSRSRHGRRCGCAPRRTPERRPDILRFRAAGPQRTSRHRVVEEKGHAYAASGRQQGTAAAAGIENPSAPTEGRPRNAHARPGGGRANGEEHRRCGRRDAARAERH